MNKRIFQNRETNTFHNYHGLLYEEEKKRNNNSFSFVKEKTEKFSLKDLPSEIKNNSNKKYNKNNMISTDSKISYYVNSNRSYSKINKLEETKIINSKSIKILYTFNIFDIISSLLCKYCLPKKLSFKNSINQKANDFLYNKLNIILYIRNMILLDIINNTLLDNNKKSIMNFLSHPMISTDKEKEEISEFYKEYNMKDFEKIFDGINELVINPNKKEREKNLIFLINKKLKEVL
mgnify:FL=1